MELRKDINIKDFVPGNMDSLGYVNHSLSGYKRKTYFSPPFMRVGNGVVEIHSNLVGKDRTVVRIEPCD